METPVEETFAIARRAHAAGAHTLLNVAPAAPIPIEALADLDWLLLNEGEAATVARGLGLAAAGPHETAGRIAEATDVGVVVTLGAEGAVAAVGAERWAVQALLVEPVDTTGAGDAFVGAFAAALDLGRPVEEALRFASAAGGLACLVLGAQPSLPRRDAIERALARLPAAAPF
jgi:ribokinase